MQPWPLWLLHISARRGCRPFAGAHRFLHRVVTEDAVNRELRVFSSGRLIGLQFYELGRCAARQNPNKWLESGVFYIWHESCVCDGVYRAFLRVGRWFCVGAKDIMKADCVALRMKRIRRPKSGSLLKSTSSSRVRVLWRLADVARATIETHAGVSAE